MTETAHTPGPWKNTGCHITNSDTYIAFAQNDVADAVAGVKERKVPEPREARANAALIAAAPDLLDALIELSAVIGLTAIKYPEHLAILQKSVDRANATIAKAECR